MTDWSDGYIIRSNIKMQCHPTDGAIHISGGDDFQRVVTSLLFL
jgi:hypothetical protein